MTGFRLGIDYGTSNTVAMLVSPDGRRRPLLFDGSPLLPSMVYTERADQLLTGTDAVRAARVDPGSAEPNPKLRIGDGEIALGGFVLPVSTLIQATLRTVLREAERVAGERLSSATLTHPAEWGSLRSGVLSEAATRAGISELTLVPEPEAAAAYFASLDVQRVPPGSSVVVYDLGAGTCDAAVVRRGTTGLETLAVGGLDDVGGLDLDAVVVGVIRAAIADNDPETWRRLSTGEAGDLRHRAALWTAAREAKESLSRRSSVMVHVPILERALPIGREEFEVAAGPLLERTTQLTNQVVARSAVPREQIAGVFLVGGASRVPLVATVLHRATGIAPTVLDQPELVVAEGSLLVAPADHHGVTARPTGEPAGGSGPEIDETPSRRDRPRSEEIDHIDPVVRSPGGTRKPPNATPGRSETAERVGKRPEQTSKRRLFVISLLFMASGCSGVLASPFIAGTAGTSEAFENPIANVFGTVMLVSLIIFFASLRDPKK
ncbi:Hsp70 family protein [Stackebrandtia soli]|uniref:Hsp70 family protein n=1 Tax=Stackebrandtia soli TaxID=1892856 RepID=UPI0039E81549